MEILVAIGRFILYIAVEVEQKRVSQLLESGE